MKYITYITLAIAMSFVSCSKEELFESEIQVPPVKTVSEKLILAEENVEIKGIWGDLYHSLLPGGEKQVIFVTREKSYLKNNWTGTYYKQAFPDGSGIIGCNGPAVNCKWVSDGNGGAFIMTAPGTEIR